MIICHCNGISDRTIRRSIRNGATTLGELRQICGAGDCCGTCTPALRSLLKTESSSEPRETTPQKRLQTAAFA